MVLVDPIAVFFYAILDNIHQVQALIKGSLQKM